MEAVILCGGLGTRLRSVVSDRPKSMADINGKPFLQYQIEYLKNYGINNFVLAVGYMHSFIENYFNDGSAIGVNIKYAYEEMPLGTAGAIKNAFNLVNDDYAVVLNGDTFFEIDYKLFEKNFVAKKCKMLIALKYEKDVSRFGKVTFDDNGLITSFGEKNCSSDGFINGGIYIINKNIVNKIPNGKISLENDIMPKLIDEGKIYSELFPNHSIDIGIPESLEKFKQYVLLEKRKILFLDRDGTINEDDGYSIDPNNIKIIESTQKLINEWKKDDALIIVISNQSGVARGYYTEDDVNIFNKELDNTLGNIIDGFYYCPYYKNGVIEKYKKDSYMRKPNPGLLMEVEEDLENGLLKYCGRIKKVNNCRIDKINSIMVGDKQTDIDCANNFGIKGELINV